ncbi:isocitrate lyase/phosphoenolpyruvate mutase family protein [Acidobacterium sp. S8]|uniref:isocitrate lyase/phosphoenolpyruvate mutase family protein n=1 Tax=Acidobacterium sp. S8 TaxID=1641854 RepID=UPI00352F4FB2
MSTQAAKGQAFHALHERDHPFIIPNPWDTGTARLLAYLGYEALATTSAGYPQATSSVSTCRRRCPLCSGPHF